MSEGHQKPLLEKVAAFASSEIFRNDWNDAIDHILNQSCQCSFVTDLATELFYLLDSYQSHYLQLIFHQRQRSFVRH